MDRRHDPRYPFACEFESTLPKRGRQLKSRWKVIHGKVLNISAGGVCVLTSAPAESFAALEVRFRFPGVPVPIPSIMQVRWVQQVALPEGAYRLGLIFIT